MQISFHKWIMELISFGISEHNKEFDTNGKSFAEKSPAWLSLLESIPEELTSCFYNVLKERNH